MADLSATQELVSNLEYIKILLAVIAILIGIVGWFVRKEISNFGIRIDKHDEILFSMTGHVQRLVGYYEATKNHMYENPDFVERRLKPRS